MPSTFFTPLMGFAMRPNEPNWPARYHRGNMDLFWQKELRLPFQMEADYEQKVETGDPIRFQVKSTTNLAHRLDIIDCRGKLITTLNTTQTPASYPGDVNDAGETYIVYHYAYANWKNLNGIGDIFKGTYHFLYTVIYDASTTEQYISEPLSIKAYQPDTVLMEVTHPRYYMGSPFDMIAAIFRFRFEAYIENFTPRSEATVFNDQKRDVKVLDFNPYRIFRLYVGEPVGMADWAFAQINCMLGCRNILIDGKQYTISTSNPSWGKDETIGSPQKTGNIEIQEAVSGEGYTMPVRKIKLWTSMLPTQTYVIGEVTIGPFTIYGPKKLAFPADETAIITALNNNIQASELRGTITQEGTNFYYNNAPGESYKTSFVPIYDRALFWNFQDPAASPTITFKMGDYDGVVFWGDGIFDRYTIGASPENVQHTYIATGLYVIEAWCQSIGYFALTNQYCSIISASVRGLAFFIVNNHTFTNGAWDYAGLQPSKNTLRAVDISSNNLTSTKNLTLNNWPLLTNVNASKNKLSNAETSKVLIDMDTITGSLSNAFGATIDVTAQTPPATLTTQGQTAKTNLQIKHFIVRN